MGYVSSHLDQGRLQDSLTEMEDPPTVQHFPTKTYRERMVMEASHEENLIRCVLGWLSKKNHSPRNPLYLANWMKLQTDLERNKCQLVVLGLYVFFCGKNLRKKILPVPYLANIGTIRTSPAAFFALAHSSNLWKIIGPAEPVPSKGGLNSEVEQVWCTPLKT